ncbi:MAG: hypothetical protein C0622_08265 [Desulfuromonas sp.]|nr:MAG: hypothetical protein C0622_08265 [Desulfuromonas sp.]
MKKTGLLLVLFILVATISATTVLAKDYRFMDADVIKSNLASNAPMTLVDIQVEDEFNQHHIIDAVATYAYPVKSAAERAKLDASIAELKGNHNMAVVVCPRGGGGAKRAYDYMVESGIAEERVYILTNGQAKWPYPELLAK